MKLEPIVDQLRITLPQFTDKVTDRFSIVSMSFVGSTVTVETSAAHNLSVSDSALVQGTKVKTPITSLTSVGTVATAVTSFDHDLTLNNEIDVEIIGADQSDYNGTFDLLSVDNRENFTYRLNADPGVSPATGTIFSIRDRLDGFNGAFTVASTPTATSFTYDLGFTPPGNPEFSGGFIDVDFRILGVLTQPTAENEYTARASQDDYFVFVQLGDATVNRDRLNNTDFTNVWSQNTEKRMKIIRPVAVYVFIPAKTDLGGPSVRDDLEDFALALYKSLNGFSPPQQTQSSQGQVMLLTGHRSVEYTNSLYIHAFDFEAREDIGIEDSYQVLTRAFRDARIVNNNNFDEIITDVTINLDEEPLP